MKKLFEKYYWIFFLVLCFVMAFMCFYKLDADYVSSWDEARHGVNAYEMLKKGNMLVQTMDYEVDYWNLKPPLSFYGIMLGYLLFGYNVVALRFYSACAYLLMTVSIAIFMKKHYGALASISSMCFFCCNYYVLGYHGARAGDADAIYMLFFTLSLLCMMEIRNNHSRLYLSGLFFALAFLSKSFHACLLIPIGGLYLLITGLIKEIKWKEWLIFIASFTLPLGVWGIARYTQDGFTFFREMLYTDVLNRSSSVSEGHEGTFGYYYDTFFASPEYIYRTILLLVVIGAVYYLLFRRTKKLIERYLAYVLWFVIPYVLFSAASTKLVWYGYIFVIPLFMAGAIILSDMLQDKRIWLPVRTVFAIGMLVIVLHNMHDTYNVAIGEAHGNTLQSFISESVTREGKYAGKDAYIQAEQEMEDGTIWNQNAIFIAEITGDLYCIDGGIQKFLTDDDALLYISNEEYASNRDSLENLKVVFETNEYRLITNH